MFVVNYKSTRLNSVLNKAALMSLDGEVQVGTDMDMPESNLIGKLRRLLGTKYLNTTVSLPLLNLAFDYHYRKWLNDIAVDKGTSVKETLKQDNVLKLMEVVVPDMGQKTIVPAIVATYEAPFRNWFTSYTLDMYEEGDELRTLGLIETNISASEFNSEGVPIGCCLVERDGDMQLKVIALKMTYTEAVTLSEMDDIDLETRFLLNVSINLETVDPGRLYGAYRLGSKDTKKMHPDLSNLGGVAITESFWSSEISPMKGYGFGLKGEQTNTAIDSSKLITYFNSLFDPYISQLGLSIYVSPIFIAIRRYFIHKLARSLAGSADAPIQELTSEAIKYIAHDKDENAANIAHFLMDGESQITCCDYLRVKHVTFLRPILSLYNLHNGEWIAQIGLNPSKQHAWLRYRELLESQHSPIPNVQEWLKNTLTLKNDATEIADISLESVYKGTNPELSEKAMLTDQSFKNIIIYVALYIAQRNQGE